MASNDIARVYASSLVEIGQREKNLQQVNEELAALSDLIFQDEQLKELISSPCFSKSTKKGLFNRVMSGNFSELIISFVNVLIDNDRLGFIREISRSLSDQIDIINKILRISVVSRFSLPDDMKSKIKTQLEERFKKNIVISEEISDRVLGGIVFKIGDTVIDGSLVKDLVNIRHNLLTTEVRSELAYEN